MDVDINENYAFVANFEAGLRIIEISNPSAPEEVGYYNTPGEAVGVDNAGDLAYVADGDSGLRIIDVSNPSLPYEVGHHEAPGYAQGVAVVGYYAFLADGVAGLQVIDVSNPTAPSLAGYYNTLGEAVGVAVVGNFAYVADLYYLGIYDCSAALPVAPEAPSLMPTSFALFPSHPNPFNASTAIHFQLPVASFVKLEILDIAGRIVGARHASPASWSGATPTIYPAGTHEIPFNASDLPSGIYICRIAAGDWSAAQKLVLLK